MHEFERCSPAEGPIPTPMPGALRAMARRLGEPSFASLSTGASRRLSFACNGFADLIQAGEGTTAGGENLRSGAGFLVSALSALRSSTGAPLSRGDETWMVAEIEADFGEALARFEARTGRPRSPVPLRPQIPRAPDFARRSGQA
jgi:hypothetical protein